MQNQLHQRQQFLCITMKKPIVPDPPKPFGQHMLHDQAQKILSFEGAILCIAGFAFNILKGYLAILIGNNIFFTDNTTI